MQCEAVADGSWSLLEPVEALIVPDGLAAAFDAETGARDQSEALTASFRRAYPLWIATAKRADTRDRRVTQTAQAVARGKRLEDR